RKQMKEAHESHDDDAMVQAEVLISESTEALLAFAQSQASMQGFIDGYQKVNQNLSTAIKNYHGSIEAYDDLIEQFAESVLIAVLEKYLFPRSTYFKVTD